MEYRRAYHDEQPDAWLVARHEREISPLLHRRHLFAEVRDFLLYDFFTDRGHVNEDVFAYSNRRGEERALVVFNNRYASTRGWVRLSCAYAEKTAEGKRLRQRTLGESLGLAADPSVFAAYRDAFTGLEFLHRAHDLAERGLNIELHAYQTNVFLDWRDLRDDLAHPWGSLCDMLAGRGVPSLEDALRDLRLKPVHQALRAVVDPALAEALAGCARLRGGAERAARASSVIEAVRDRAGALLVEVESYASSAAGKGAATTTERDWRRSAGLAQESLSDRIEAALKLPALYKKAAARWPAEAHAVLPLDDKPRPQTTAVWRAMLGWCALEAVGRFQDPNNPEAAAAELFDTLRLRGPLAEALAAPGMAVEEHWRAAARLRASFAHSSRPAAPDSWIHDPDVAWLIGVHPHEGVDYLAKEHFERLLWWMALRGLLDWAGGARPDLENLDLVKEKISERMQTVAHGGYRVESLAESAALEGLRNRERKMQEK